MSHLDDGTLHALLDGEIPSADLPELQRHLDRCADCARRLQAERALMTEADALVVALDPPGEQRRDAAPAAPVVWSRRLTPRVRRNLAWAATVVLAAGLGFYANEYQWLAQRSPSTTAMPATDQVSLERTEPSAPAQPEAGRAPSGGEQRLVPAPAPPNATAPTDQPLRQAARDREQDAESVAGRAMAKTGVMADEVMVVPENRANGFVVQGARPDRAEAAAPAPVPAAAPAEGDDGWRSATLEEAVTQLNGKVYLLDGSPPLRIEIGPGSNRAGLSPDRAAVRIRYGEGDEAVVLYQQRVGLAAAEADRAAPARAAVSRLDTIVSRGTDGISEARWAEPGGFRLILQGRVSPDLLLRLVDRVR